jgi:hypothetical protein
VNYFVCIAPDGALEVWFISEGYWYRQDSFGDTWIASGFDQTILENRIFLGDL